MLLGVMDDALLGNVPDVAFPAVQQLHPQVIRYDLSWAHTAPRKPADATNPDDPAYDWSLVDQVVVRADALGVPVMLTIEVTPRWAGGGTGNKAPVNMASLQAFAYAAATRYSGQHVVPATGQVLPAVTRWEAWNEPNTTSHLNAAVQLPLRAAPCRSRRRSTPRSSRRSTWACTPPARTPGVIEIVAGGATKPNYSGPQDVRARRRAAALPAAARQEAPAARRLLPPPVPHGRRQEGRAAARIRTTSRSPTCRA